MRTFGMQSSGGVVVKLGGTVKKAAGSAFSWFKRGGWKIVVIFVTLGLAWYLFKLRKVSTIDARSKKKQAVIGARTTARLTKRTAKLDRKAEKRFNRNSVRYTANGAKVDRRNRKSRKGMTPAQRRAYDLAVARSRR
jgi:hypothetical protein